MDKFSYTPDEVFNDTSAYSDPQSESEVREQLSRPHKQIEEYINNKLLPAIASGDTNIQSQIDDTLTPAIEARMKTATYDANGNGIVDNAEKVNNHTVDADVPPNAVFTDTTYKQASETVMGIAKMYSGTGTGTDGSMTQKAVTDAIQKAAFGDITIDTEMSDTSENPVQNKTVKQYVDVHTTMTNCPFPIGFGGFFQTDPNSIYSGTTWEQKKDVFILASGTAYPAGSTGGEAEHMLAEKELPKVSGVISFMSNGNKQGIVSASETTGVFSASQMSSGEFVPNNRADSTNGARSVKFNLGANNPHNNMPPYFSMPFWIRTA